MCTKYEISIFRFLYFGPKPWRYFEIKSSLKKHKIQFKANGYNGFSLQNLLANAIEATPPVQAAPIAEPRVARFNPMRLYPGELENRF